VLWVFGCPALANAQTPGQLWLTGTATWLASDRLQLRVQFESQDQFIVPDNQPTFLSTDTTPRVLYVLASWIDVLGEVAFGTKDQSDNDDSTSLTPRVGVQLHILSRLLSGGADPREHPPRFRWDFRSLLRLEDQREKSSGHDSTTSTWIFRDRFRVAYPINRPKTTSNGAIYLATDWETFVPLDGGFINQLRARNGIGYRLSFPWRFEALYVWQGERSRPSESLSTKDNALDLRVYYQF
jgi:uncharacterized protein DUF2490